jgi:hypothetical protein
MSEDVPNPLETAGFFNLVSGVISPEQGKQLLENS